MPANSGCCPRPCALGTAAKSNGCHNIGCMRMARARTYHDCSGRMSYAHHLGPNY